jgi:hypothetical protein
MADTEEQPFSVIQEHHVRAALAELDAAAPHPWGAPTKFHLVIGGRSYAPKAVVGLAYRQATGSLPRLERLSGGEDHANAVLQRLGFDVTRIDPTGEDWTVKERELLVADYDMLAAELSGQKYNKAEHNRRLRQSVDRARGSIERKHMNVSAVLVEMALPYINGYKPNVNIQGSLVETVDDFLGKHPDFFDRPQIITRIEPRELQPVTVQNPADHLDSPPDIEIAPRAPQPWKSRRGRKLDYAARDAQNRRLGELGERFTFDLERLRLREARRDDLVNRVRWVAQTDGDGVGYDILSFNEATGEERWLEVKTTALGKFHPFLVTANEVACSEAEPRKFHLYRVFEFRDRPKVFVLPGSLRSRCELQAVAYRAGPPFNVPADGNC